MSQAQTQAPAPVAAPAKGAALANEAKTAYANTESADHLASGEVALDSKQPEGGSHESGDDEFTSNSTLALDDATDADAPAAAAPATEPAKDGEAPKPEPAKEGEPPADGETPPAATAAVGEESFEVGDKTVKVNFADAAVRKKLVHAASQRQRFQAERDKAQGDLKTAKPKADQFDLLNDAWKAGGDDGVESLKSMAKVLKGAGGDELIDRLVQVETDRRAAYAKLSPDAKKAYDAERVAETATRALASERAKVEAERATARAKSDADADAARQASFDAAFKEVSFAGKLGDSALEERLDRQVFAAAQMDLAEAFDTVKADGGDWSKVDVSALAKKFVKAHASVHKALVKGQVKTEVKAALDKATDDATAKAQALMGGQPAGGQAKPGTKGAKGAASGPLPTVEQSIAKIGYAATMKAVREGRVRG